MNETKDVCESCKCYICNANWISCTACEGCLEHDGYIIDCEDFIDD